MDDRSRALLLIGLLLLSAPVWAPLLDITGPDYHYNHSAISIEDGKVSVDAPLSVTAPTDQIDCFGIHAVEEDRICRFEQALLQGNLTVEPTAAGTGGIRPGGTDYVVFGSNGAVYERTFARHDEGYELGLDRVDPEVALDRVAWNLDVHSDLRRAVENDGIETNEPILSDRSAIVESGSGYHIVYESGRSQFLSAKPGVERGIEALLTAIGAYLVFTAGYHAGRRD